MRVVYVTQVWPEPRSSAAGLRALNVIRALHGAHELTVACVAKNEEARQALVEAGYFTHALALNDSSADEWFKQQQPDLVIFERFMIEEQFGARVALACPLSARILDTIDLHFLRRARQAGTTDWNTEECYRELASIYRCDHTWLVSDFEKRFLEQELGVPSELLSVSRFSTMPPLATRRSYADRQHFVSIGNFRHAPNHDAAMWLHGEIWPLIRRQLPQAEVHLYGAYAPREISALHDPAQGFLVRGWADDAVATVARYRLALAPLRFGAGIKGKILDAWSAGTPVVTTPVGAEGMTAADPFPGPVVETPAALAVAAVALLQDEVQWHATQARADQLNSRLYAASAIETAIRECAQATVAQLAPLRARNRIGRLLELNTTRSTLYFSRWIEAKNSSGTRRENSH